MKLKRELYLQQIRPFYESDIIKVITGVRRAGKSVLYMPRPGKALRHPCNAG